MPLRSLPLVLVACAGLVLPGCSEDGTDPRLAPSPVRRPAYTEARAPCADFHPFRKAYFGDLHAHAAPSFDAWMWDVRLAPEDAYRFARGATLWLPPLDDSGLGTREARIDRPLDFAAVTDHAELLAETLACVTPGSGAYTTPVCELFRQGQDLSYVFGIGMILPEPRRFPDVCGPDGARCADLARQVWGQIRDAADGAYDRSEACSFTAFVAYEYTANTDITNVHRNVIFRNDRVPALPVSYYEQTSPEGLWDALRRDCLEAEDGCDVMAVPHNANLSNGRMFAVVGNGEEPLEVQRARAELRARLEPVVEIFQHKGDGECMNGLSGVLGGPDPLCDFEKLRRPPFEDCEDGTGALGMMGLGCVSRYDYVRNVLLLGLQEAERLGVNPYRLGFLGSTDTHNVIPGAVAEDRYLGNSGKKEDTPAERLGPGGLTPKGRYANPGGLTGVWAVENSRDAIFEAIRRRETFATSGPRIQVRFFGGWRFAEGMCEAADAVRAGYARGVPMGGALPAAPGPDEAPTFYVSARRDPGPPGRPGTPLQRVQIVKGWITPDRQPMLRVFEVAGDPFNGADVLTDTCETVGTGFDRLCAVWTDPEFLPGQRAFYYARVIENPTCRWSTYECNRLAGDERPADCDDPALPRVIQERAWSSPIGYGPGGR